MIRLESISKQNGHQILFIEASAALQRGEKVGLVGPNGAGKTTALSMATGLLRPDFGSVHVHGLHGGAAACSVSLYYSTIVGVAF